MRNIIGSIVVMAVFFSASTCFAGNVGISHGPNPAQVNDFIEQGTPPTTSSATYKWEKYKDITMGMMTFEELDRFCGDYSVEGKAVKRIEDNKHPVWFFANINEAEAKTYNLKKLGAFRANGKPGAEEDHVMYSGVCEGKKQTSGMIALVFRKDRSGLTNKSLMLGGGAMQASLGGMTDASLQATSIGLAGGIGKATGETWDVPDARIVFYTNPELEELLLSRLENNPATTNGNLLVLGEIGFTKNCGEADQVNQGQLSAVAQKVKDLDLGKYKVYIAGGYGEDEDYDFTVLRAESATEALGNRLISEGIKATVVCENLKTIMEPFGITSNKAVVYASPTTPTKPE